MRIHSLPLLHTLFMPSMARTITQALKVFRIAEQSPIPTMRSFVVNDQA